MRVKRLREMSPGKVIRLVLAHRNDVFRLLEMSFIDSAYREGAELPDECMAYAQRSGLMRMTLYVIKEVTGDMLLAEGYEPGPKFGEILFQRRVERFKRLQEI